MKTEHNRVIVLGRQGPALALLLLLGCAVAGTVLAVGGTAISVSASSRRRSYELAALRTIGISTRMLLRAGVYEQLLLLGTAVVPRGCPAGSPPPGLAIPAIPEFSDTTPVRLHYIPSAVPVVLFVAGVRTAVDGDGRWSPRSRSSGSRYRVACGRTSNDRAVPRPVCSKAAWPSTAATSATSITSAVRTWSALHDLQLNIYAGENVAIFGPSGSGKSTLMTLLAGLRRPTSGQLYLGGDDITRMSERDLLRLRGQRIGVVVQKPSRKPARLRDRGGQRPLRPERGRSLSPTHPARAGGPAGPTGAVRPDRAGGRKDVRR